MRKLAAVLWDLDGTLVDTEPLWMAAENDLAASVGKVWTHDDGLELVGRDLLDSGRYLRSRLGLTLTPAEIVDELVGRMASAMRRNIDWQPGARELVDALQEAKIPQALVTMSYRPIAAPVIAAVQAFAVVVTGDSVVQGKPHPEPYLRAASELGVDPSSCVAIEDSPTGADSATAAGCFVVAVPHYVNVEVSPRRAIVPSLAGISVDDLARLAGLD